MSSKPVSYTHLAFSGLQDIMDGMLDHTETTMDDVSFRLDNISAMSDEARESTDYLVHRTEDYVDDTIMTINDLSVRADRFLGDLEDILGTCLLYTSNRLPKKKLTASKLNWKK